MSDVSEVKVRRGVFSLYDRDGDFVGQVSAGTGRALIGDSFYVRERTCRPEVCYDGAGACGVYCSECGYRFAGPHGKREVSEHMATRRDIMPRYCPSCGARAEVNE